ncbi:GTP-binding protein [Legionella clemsonensis]|uniref:GTPase Era n=1 Tax=Legionella clemsonensis TaxID=1867846 RepID=A0A222P405_9GAMM|nr:GTP-binding protein [Legionella clemsonensis]ASQ46578.1 GTPase Era [Legionella clemsonensis]
MSGYKIITIGAENTGKTQLLRRIVSNNFSETYKPSMGMDFCSLKKNNDSLHLWDISGDSKTFGMTLPFFRHADLGLYCVDLSNPTRFKKEYLESFKTHNPDKKIILVGTKMDLLADTMEEQTAKAQEILNNIEGSFATRIAVSAKNRTNLELLENLLFNNTLSDKFDFALSKLSTDSSFYVALKQLQEKIKNIPQEKYQAVAAISLELVENLLSNSSSDKKQEAIEQFTKKCTPYLEKEHPYALKAVFSVAAVAFVTLLATVIGFGLGLWSGPGAIATALIAGTTTFLAAGSGFGIYTNRIFFFKEIDAEIDHVAECANKFVNENSLSR